FFYRVAQAPACRGLLFDRRDDPSRCRDADVGHDQQLFARVERVDVDRAALARRRFRLRRNLIEPLNDLLLGFGETFANTIEKTHYVTSVFCGRSISSSTAAAALRLPASTSPICFESGTSPPGFRPSASAAVVVFTPSATIFMPATTSEIGRPCAS